MSPDQRHLDEDLPTDRFAVVIPSPRSAAADSATPRRTRGRGVLLAAVAVLLVVVGVLGGLLVARGDSAAPVAAPATPTRAASPTTTVAPSAAADRRVCIDFDARGGALYTLFVVPMMAGDAGQKSVDVDIARMRHATSSLTQLGRSDIAAASPALADEGERLVTAAGAMGMYSHADGTALLTAFVGLAVECQKADHKPSWFDAESLGSA